MFEMQTFERKREYNRKAQNTMLSFLNTDGGILYIGIADDGSVYGVDGDIDELARSITNSFRDSVTPDPSGYGRPFLIATPPTVLFQKVCMLVSGAIP